MTELTALRELIEDEVEDMRNLARHADMVEIAAVRRILDRIKAAVDDLTPNFGFGMTSPAELNRQLEHLIEQQSVAGELRTDKHELEQELRELRAELEELKC